MGLARSRITITVAGIITDTGQRGRTPVVEVLPSSNRPIGVPMKRGIVALAIVVLGTLPARSADPLFDTAANGHRQTVESITSLHLHLRVEIDDVSDKGLRTSQRFWEDLWHEGDKVRSRYKVEFGGGDVPNGAKAGDKSNNDRLLIGQRLTSLNSVLIPGRKPQNTAALRNVDPAGESCDWARSAALFKVSDGPVIWLKDALRSKNWKWKKAAWDELGGARVILLEGETAGDGGVFDMSYRVWLDPAVGYLVRRTESHGYRGAFDPERTHWESEVVRFHPPYKETGISFPAEVVDKGFSKIDGLPEWTRGTRRCVFENVRINEPVPADAFTLKIPAGYWVVDRITAVQYTSGPDGKPATPLVPIIDIPQPPEVRSSWWLSYTLVGAGVAALALGTVIAIRRRQPRTLPTGPSTGV